VTLVEFIKERYPIDDKLEQLKTNPIKRIMESDFLPCDAVKMVDGVFQKVVELSDEQYIPVVELLSYSKEDIEQSNDQELKDVWFAYMDNVTVKDVSFDQIMSASSEFMRLRKKKEELINACTSS